MRSTIKDVAKEAGVSITTVSLVLNNSKASIPDSTKDKVIDAAKKLRYVPNKIARSLVNKKTHLLALILPDITNPFYGEIASFVNMAAQKRGYKVLYINDSEGSDFNSDIDFIYSNMIDGVLIVTRNSKKWNLIDAQESIKFVYLDEPVYCKNDHNDVMHMVSGDNFAGGYMVAKYLIGLGHKQMACIVGSNNTPNSRDRLSGFLKCCEENDIKVKDEHILEGFYTYEGGYKCGVKLSAESISAVFAFNDLSAFGAIKAFNSVGIRVPSDMSVMGYDNLFMNKFVDPPLSTVDQNIQEISQKAANMLIDLIENVEVKEKKVFIKPELIIRSTCTKFRG